MSIEQATAAPGERRNVTPPQRPSGLVSIGWVHPGEWRNCFGQSLIDLIAFDMATNRRVLSHSHGILPKECGAGELVACRNNVTETFLAGSADWLLFIDSDMGFAADTAERLIATAESSGAGVVGALAFAARSDGTGPFFGRRYRMVPTLWFMHEAQAKFAPMFDYPRDQVVEVDATGAACLLVARGLLEQMREQYGATWWDRIEVGHPDGRRVFSEDLSFCIRARALGSPIVVDTSVKTTHDKGNVFYDEATYDLQQAMLRLKEQA